MTNKKTLDNTKLSIISLLLTTLQIILIPLQIFISKLNYISMFPFIIISLILSIISQYKYNDTLSFNMLIINSILINVGIVTIVILLIFTSIGDVIINSYSTLPFLNIK